MRTRFGRTRGHCRKLLILFVSTASLASISVLGFAGPTAVPKAAADTPTPTDYVAGPSYGVWVGTISFTWHSAQYEGLAGQDTVGATFTTDGKASVSGNPELAFNDNTSAAWTQDVTMQEDADSWYENGGTAAEPCSVTITDTPWANVNDPNNAFDVNVFSANNTSYPSQYDIGATQQTTETQTVVYAGPSGCPNHTDVYPNVPQSRSAGIPPQPIGSDPEHLKGTYIESCTTSPSNDCGGGPSYVNTWRWDLHLQGSTDTDGDGFDDYTEFVNSTDPQNPSSTPSCMQMGLTCGPDNNGGTPPITHTIAGSTPGDRPSNCSGCPVNTATGEFHQSFTDLAIPGRGMPLNLTRTYSSLRAAQNSPFGYGWASSYTMSLSIDKTTGNATVNETNGSSELYTSKGSGVFNGPSWDFATLSQNTTTGNYTYARTTGESYVFNSTGQLIQEIDRNANTTTLAYSGGKLATVTDPGGRTLTFSYGTNGDVSSVKDSSGRKVSYSYGGSGNLLSVTNAGGGVTKFTYDLSHRMLTMTDPRGGVSTLTYNSAGEVASWSDPMGRKSTYAYAGTVGSDETTTETDARGDVTLWHNDDLELISKTLGYGTPSAATSAYTYDPTTFALTSLVDPNGNVTISTNDAHGNLLSSTDPLGRTTTYTYNSFGEVLTKKDPLGVTTTNTYDTHGNLLTTSTAVGTSKVTTTYTYGGVGNELTMRNPDNKTSTFTYDNYGNRLTDKDPLGNTTTDTYNTLGENTSESTPLGHKSTYTYDPFADLLTTTDPNGNVTKNSYDADQNPLTTTDAKGDVTTKTYDADNEVTSAVVTNPSKVTLSSQSITYDAAGNVASQINGDSKTTTYAYDPLNRKISSTDPLGRTTTYTYDPVGNQLTETDPSGRVTAKAYDADNEPTSVTYSDGVTPNVTYTYDADGRRLTMSDGTGTTTYTYDALGRLTSDTQGGGQVVKYGYDLASNLTTLTYQGHTVTRTYDADSRLTAVKDWLGNTTPFAYDSDSNLVTQTDPNGVVTTNTFDNTDHLTGSSTVSGSTTLLGLTYTRDSLYNVTAENSTTYGYDGAQRLTSSSSGSSPLAYDQANQLSSAGSTTYSYDAASEPVSTKATAGTTGYSYDPQGERTTMTPPTGSAANYAWNQAGQLSGFTKGSTTASYVYNGDGLRMSKTVGTAKYPYVYDMAEGIPLLMANTFTNYVTGPGGLPLEQITGSTVTYYTHDQLGSTRLLTNSSGASVGTYTYTPYGAVASHTGTVSTSLEFAGEFTDNETGFQYLQARYYDPSTGQFVSVDPLVELTGEPYSYADDNPVNRTDPAGLWCGFGCSLEVGGEGLANFASGAFNTGKDTVIDVVGSVVGIETGNPAATSQLASDIPDIDQPFCGPGLGFSYELGEATGPALVVLTGTGAAAVTGLAAELEVGWVLFTSAR